MSTYLLGLATLPALAAGLGAVYLILRGLLWLAAKVPGCLVSLGKEPSENQRAKFSSIIYGAKRAKFAVFGEIGFVIVVGLDDGLRQKAYESLVPKATINPNWLRD